MKKTNTISKIIYVASGTLIGLSAVFLAQANYTVQTNIENAVQVIKKVIVEKTDGTDGTTIDGAVISAQNLNLTQDITSRNIINNNKIYSAEYCNEFGQDCINISDVSTSGGTDSFATYSGDYDTTGIIDDKIALAALNVTLNLYDYLDTDYYKT